MFLDIFYCLDFSCLSISRSYLLSGLLYQIYTHLSDFFLLLSYIHIIYFIYSFFQLPVICFFLTTLRIPSFLCLLALSSSSFLTLAEIISKCLQVVRRRRHRISFFFFLFHLFIPIFLSTFDASHQAPRVGVSTWILANQGPRKVQVQWRTVISVSRSGYLICRLQDYPIVKIWNTSCMAVLIRFSLCFAMKMLIIW